MGPYYYFELYVMSPPPCTPPRCRPRPSPPPTAGTLEFFVRSNLNFFEARSAAWPTLQPRRRRVANENSRLVP